MAVQIICDMSVDWGGCIVWLQICENLIIDFKFELKYEMLNTNG